LLQWRNKTASNLVESWILNFTWKTESIISLFFNFSFGIVWYIFDKSRQNLNQNRDEIKIISQGVFSKLAFRWLNKKRSLIQVVLSTKFHLLIIVIRSIRLAIRNLVVLPKNCPFLLAFHDKFWSHGDSES